MSGEYALVKIQVLLLLVSSDQASVSSSSAPPTSPSDFLFTRLFHHSLAPFALLSPVIIPHSIAHAGYQAFLPTGLTYPRRNPTHGRDASPALPLACIRQDPNSNYTRDVPSTSFTHFSNPIRSGLLDVYGPAGQRHGQCSFSRRPVEGVRLVCHLRILVCPSFFSHTILS